MSERANSEPRRVGLIGLGKMGQPMARNLLKADFVVVVHSRSRGPVDELAAEGAVAVGTPAEVAAEVEVVLTSLPDPAAVEDVYFGEDGLVGAARRGQVFLDTSTVAPKTSRDVAAAMNEKGAVFLDAPVSGGVAGAIAGTLTVMVGGDAEAFERARPVLEVIGERLHHVGPSGAGTVIKLANQLLVGINMAGVAEAMVLGVKAGADPAKMLEVLSTSFGGSRMLDRGVPLIIGRNFGGGTPVDLIRKDLGLIANLAQELGIPLAEGDAARRVFDEASEANYGGNDMTAVILPMERIAGIEVSAETSA
ncbi:MAG: NAD(P)-dependent oxidoreductase [Chloroflexota bacterium]|nr:NAD(P)-dependent oxidoreductase [Chloroflexota bacterium]